jgi:hypothetical membrane protein
MNKFNQPLIIMKAGVLWFYFFALIAHFFAPSSYSILNNNFSQLGPQGYNLSWIMQIAFIGSALLWIYGLYLNFKNPVLHKSVAWMFLGISLFIILAGIFKTTLPEIEMSLGNSSSIEKNIHLFAAHGSQILGLIILLEHIKKSSGNVKNIHVTILIALIILSLIFQFGPFMGISQRVLALTHSFWTLKYLNLYG